jgi:hypothetical protein
MEKNNASSYEKADFLLLKNCCKISLGLKLEPDPKLYPSRQCCGSGSGSGRIRNFFLDPD